MAFWRLGEIGVHKNETKKKRVHLKWHLLGVESWKRE